MKDHQRGQYGRPLGPIVTTPTPSLTDQETHEVGDTVMVNVLGRIVAVRPAGNGRSFLKVDTAPEGQPTGGQWVMVITDDPAVEIERIYPRRDS